MAKILIAFLCVAAFGFIESNGQNLASDISTSFTTSLETSVATNTETLGPTSNGVNLVTPTTAATTITATGTIENILQTTTLSTTISADNQIIKETMQNLTTVIEDISSKIAGNASSPCYINSQLCVNNVNQTVDDYKDISGKYSTYIKCIKDNSCIPEDDPAFEMASAVERSLKDIVSSITKSTPKPNGCSRTVTVSLTVLAWSIIIKYLGD